MEEAISAGQRGERMLFFTETECREPGVRRASYTLHPPPSVSHSLSLSYANSPFTLPSTSSILAERVATYVCTCMCRGIPCPLVKPDTLQSLTNTFYTISCLTPPDDSGRGSTVILFTLVKSSNTAMYQCTRGGRSTHSLSKSPEFTMYWSKSMNFLASKCI